MQCAGDCKFGWQVTPIQSNRWLDCGAGFVEFFCELGEFSGREFWRAGDWEYEVG